MTTDFDRAFALVIGEEGGYVNNPADPGGETKFGISKKRYPALDIKNLTLDTARSIYLADYWMPAHCDDLPWPLDAYVFDAAVNQGEGAAIILLQKSLGVAQDGIFGSQTRKALANVKVPELAAKYAADRALRYTGTKNFDVFGRGWLKRLFDLALNTVLPSPTNGAVA